MKKLFVTLFAAMSMLMSCKTEKTPQNIVCAYVAQGMPEEVSAEYVNRIIYSSAYIDSTLSEVKVPNPERLEKVLALRKTKPGLEVMVSLGGNPSDVSLAVRDDSLRALVVASFKRMVDDYNLDGIDIDWEFPGRGEHALSTEEDVANYVRLLADLREALGNDKILTVACAGSLYGVDLDAMTPIIDQYNLMTYDMGTAPSHHTALYDSEKVAWLSCDKSVRNFIEGGVEPSKLVLGLAFYGRGRAPYGEFVDWRHFVMGEGLTERYDSVAQVPWIADSEGNQVLGYDNPESLRAKCSYARDKGLAGVMYWRMELDDSVRTLGRTVAEAMK
ncbi:MAG: hypothetical protein K2F78_04915 [Muribaculaceae bacterium]|nr:hypothetical protein [Muribaculaceae bacterium]